MKKKEANGLKLLSNHLENSIIWQLKLKARQSWERQDLIIVTVETRNSIEKINRTTKRKMKTMLSGGLEEEELSRPKTICGSKNQEHQLILLEA